jgi:hypothetical protein
LKSEVNQKVITISNFDSIILKNNRPLVICDIDETILYLDLNENYKKNFVKFPLFYSKNSSLLNGSNYNVDPIVRPILPTDIEGFRRLENRISYLGGKLIFLTARHPDTSQYVIEDFLKIGLDSSKYDIHYTGATISKGDYIRIHIDISEYDDIYFIDDLKDNIISVYYCYPEVNLYLFSREIS